MNNHEYEQSIIHAFDSFCKTIIRNAARDYYRAIYLTVYFGYYALAHRGVTCRSTMGSWQTVYKRFAQWEKDGKLKEMFENVRENPDMQDLCIDGTYIKAHRASAGAKKGIQIAIMDNALVLVVEEDQPKFTQS